MATGKGKNDVRTITPARRRYAQSLAAPSPARCAFAGRARCRVTAETGDKVIWRDGPGQYLRDVGDGQAHVLIGVRTYLVAIGELRPG